MNRAVVRAATSAVAGWLLDSWASRRAGCEPRGAGGLRVVIGCDARHRSAEFADEAAQVLAAAGISVSLLPRPCPTPLAAFAVRHLSAQAGIMITASHNPRTDNGYKLYLSDGAQVIPPADGEIEDRIGGTRPAARLSPPPAWTTRASPGTVEEVAEAYLDAITADVDPRQTEQFKVVYTPMHGVAGNLLLRAVGRAGFRRPHVVTMQGQPDPDFPTAAFPNPEDPVTLTLALADAMALDADLMLANDPDGDRLAVAVPSPIPAARSGTSPAPHPRRWPVASPQWRPGRCPPR